MLSPIIRRAERIPGRKNDPRSSDRNRVRFRETERGVTIALVAVAMVSIIAMAALSIDIGTLYQAKAEAQRAADAAALAAARTISISGITGDPNNIAGGWQLTCGTTGNATVTATAVAQAQWNLVGGAQPSTVKVTYGPGAGADDCSALSGATAFSVNPTVTVYVQQATLPTFFGKIFSLITGGTSTNSGVSATATAEVFNPSNSGSYASAGQMVPVQPRCVKPWIVPNKDPLNPALCTGAACLPFVGTIGGPTEGAIGNPGMLVNGVGTGVIGETFNLVPDCGPAGSATCNIPLIPPAPYFVNPPQPNSANVTSSPQPNLQYLPGLAPAASAAVPRCATGGGTYPNSTQYQEAIAGCDQTTAYQCGVTGSLTPNQVDLSENPVGPAGDTAIAVQCLTHQSALGAAPSGQDTLLTTSLPYQIQAGTASPIPGMTSTSVISSSTSIVSLPIYDGTALTITGATANVNIVGFLQVFINYVDPNGNVNVTVLNVAGCGSGVIAGSPSLNGTSPVPVRLITPP
jgi:Flp pilus assembly protein TadG